MPSRGGHGERRRKGLSLGGIRIWGVGGVFLIPVAGTCLSGLLASLTRPPGNFHSLPKLKLKPRVEALAFTCNKPLHPMCSKSGLRAVFLVV